MELEQEVEAPRKVSLDEYFRLEAESPERHEYRNGEMVAMSGGSYAHILISSNLMVALANRLSNRPCKALGSDLRTKLGKSIFYSYPDVTVICGNPQYDPRDKQKMTIINPTMIVEVLSPSTEANDRSEKFRGYLQIETLNEYVLVAQTSPRVESFFRQADGTWLFSYFDGIAKTSRFRSLELDIPLTEIYKGVVFPPDPKPAEVAPPE